MARPPSPSLSGSVATWLLGHLGDQRDALQTQSSTFLLVLGNQNMIVTKDPAVYRAALGLSHQKYFDRSPSITAVITYFLPRSLGAVTSHDWSRIRRTLQRGMAMQSFGSLPALVASSIQKLEQSIRRTTRMCSPSCPKIYFLASRSSSSTALFHRIMYHWDLNTVAGDSINLLQAALHLSEMFAKRVMLPFPLLWKLPLPHNYEADAALNDLHTKVVELVNARRQYLASLNELPQPTLLAYVLGALEDETLSTGQVYDNVMASSLRRSTRRPMRSPFSSTTSHCIAPSLAP
ncbi:hypothetical protein SPRG_16796 [Saprolegnia parasitica CBS 223.65]|uniref:Cytochrome P450 n=1 Tax=Saprolegnia parasitica (strain CBS 223.65) TaxID=695850 RepID=A0A067BS89_SAPPC|nr:hypothetical protein SPRG_16796 [Saprolegnia parasitica CBS 223.65]KDO17537.1 hypothetical protein SPRG_16796 [Saprolegnia parasitica CBS 223.65]|eukprot:XP_012211755.1 hypothetical protein SPRG_16796 [Saprolegnia parasitica CBS 223.65]